MTKPTVPQTARRSLHVAQGAVDMAARTVRVAFASDAPVHRGSYIEILIPTGMDLSRINAGAAVLMQHDQRDQVGCVVRDSVSVDADGVNRCTALLSRSARAMEILQDVEDGIRSQISVGYEINESVHVGTQEGVPVVHVTRWTPFEVSFVSVAADVAKSGVGRSAELPGEQPTPDSETTPHAAVVAEEESAARAQPQLKSKESTMDEIQKAVAAANARAAEILALGARHKVEDAARDFVASGKTVDDFRAHILANLKPTPVPTNNDVGMSRSETERYSLVRAIRAAADGDWSGAGFEREVSQAVAKKLGRESRGFFVSGEVFSRASQQTKGTAANGGNLVESSLLVDGYVDALRNRLKLRELGAKVTDGLVGDVAYPKKTQKSSTYWVAEDGATTPSTVKYGQVPMSPKTICGESSISRLLLRQSSIDVESDVRNDILQGIAEGIDLAAIIGGGAGGPQGLMQLLSAARVLSLDTNGGALDWSDVVEMETMIAAANADVSTMGYLTNAKVRGYLKTKEKAANTAQFIWTDGANGGLVNGYRAEVTNQVPGALTKGTGTALSALLFGDWSSLRIALWSGIDIQVDPYTLGNTGAIIVRAFQSADVACVQEESFALCKDIITN